MNLMVSKKVDLVLSGHHHLYDRTKQLRLSATCPALVPGTTSANCIADADNSYVQGAGTVFSSIGTGGVPLSRVPSTDGERPYFAAFEGQDSNPSWGFLDVVADASRLSATFRRTSGGTFTDAYTIVRPVAPAPAATVAFVGAGHSAPGAATSKAATVPAFVKPGDTLLLFLTRNSTVSWSDPTGVTGWTKVDEERDDTSVDVNWFTLMRKTATATEGTAAQTVAFSAGCPYAAVTYRVPATSGGPGTGYTSTGHGATGVQSVVTPDLVTNGPNRLGIIVAGVRQVAGVSSGVDTSTFPGSGATLIASTKTATTGTNFAISIGTQVVPAATTLVGKTVSVVPGAGTNGRFITASYSFKPGTGNTTAGETLAAYLLSTKDA